MITLIHSFRILILVLLALLSVGTGVADERPKVFAHYMPWYSYNAADGKWGWHWTMDHYNPDELRWDGRRKIASHDYPLIGPYSSADSHVLECQVQQMKLAGIDGVIFDWYGIDEVNDYGAIHLSIEVVIPVLEKAGMQFVICYEDQAAGAIAKKEALDAEGAIRRASSHLLWAEENWFRRESYFKIDDRPLMLVFGPRHFSGEQWKRTLSDLSSDPVVSVLPHLRKGAGASGVFAWPPVRDGKNISSEVWKKELAKLYEEEGADSIVVPVAFPGFRDIYKQVGLHDSYGSIGDRDGRTFSESLEQALQQKEEMIQIATWNDYGEGTVIEPTWNLGYRYLDALQDRLQAPYSPSDLRLPARLLYLRNSIFGDGRTNMKLIQASEYLFEGKVREAEDLMKALEGYAVTHPVTFPGKAGPVDPGYKLNTEILYKEGASLTEYERTRCRLDVYRPGKGEGHPVVIWFHGGGIAKGNRSIPVPLRNKGVVVVSANYRLHPRVESPDYIEDAAAAVAWAFKNISKYGGSPDRIFVSGHSAGGYLASMVGMDKSYLEAHGIDADMIAGLIPFSGHSITHFTIRKERGIGGKQAVVDSLAPLFHVRKEAPPTLLITGDRELEIYGRYEETAYFWRMMQEVGHSDTELAELEGFDHGGMPEPAFPLLLKFIEKVVKAK